MSLKQAKKAISPNHYFLLLENEENLIKLNEVAKINPNRKHSYKYSDLVDYVGLPETGDRKINEVLQRPYSEVKGRNIIKNEDILFARIEPSIFNRKYIFAENLENTTFTSTEFYVVECDKTKILPKFLFSLIFTDFVFNQFADKTTGSTGRRRLDRKIFENLQIPLPPLETQQKLVEMMDKAYKIKKEKEQKAKKLLDSVDDFVMSQLGIYPEKFKVLNPERNKIFAVKVTELIKNRIDPEYHLPKNKKLLEAVENGKFEMVELKKILEYSKKGIEVGSKKYVADGEIPFVRVADIDKYKINFENCDKKISRKNFEELKENYQPKVGEILYSKDGTVGFSVLVKEEIEMVNSGGLMRLKPKPEMLASFLQIILATKVYNQIANFDVIGEIIKHLTVPKFMEIKIPLPPLPIQQKIAEEVEKRRNQAFELQAEAREVLEKAKVEFEGEVL